MKIKILATDELSTDQDRMRTSKRYLARLAAVQHCEVKAMGSLFPKKT